MNDRKMICFDMDGTIADFYGVENWLDYLIHENPYPYITAEPLWKMDELNAVLMQLAKEGWEIRVISWLAKDSSEEYKKAVVDAKKTWLEKWDFPAEKCHFIQYGATKANCVRKALSGAPAILIDDNERVRDGWHLGETIDPTACDDLPWELGYLIEDEDARGEIFY